MNRRLKRSKSMPNLRDLQSTRLYHVTLAGNAPSIEGSGLDPARGGGDTGFASFGTERHGAHWQTQSRGKVHGGLSQATALGYGLKGALYDFRQGAGPRKRATFSWPVSLGEASSYAPDPDDVNAVTTTNRIPPSSLQFMGPPSGMNPSEGRSQVDDLFRARATAAETKRKTTHSRTAGTLFSST